MKNLFLRKETVFISLIFKTITAIKEAYDFVRPQFTTANQSFIGTKTGPAAVEKEAKRCGMLLCKTTGWLGGMLTNFTTN
ncbi:MAG: 30S ribosomal protein S2 [Spirochaetales bacterium]|nr:30S ribosomal protein S2 [Spirochaetales bacterium]